MMKRSNRNRRHFFQSEGARKSCTLGTNSIWELTFKFGEALFLGLTSKENLVVGPRFGLLVDVTAISSHRVTHHS